MARYPATTRCVLLRIRNRHYRRVCAAEEIDADGIPDINHGEPAVPAPRVVQA